MNCDKMNNIAIFASGNGTNAQALIEYFATRSTARIALLISNKPQAYALERAKRHNITTILINSKTPCSELIETLHSHRIDWIILAGYLALVPTELTAEFPNRIINIHPALLPKYGGKGMYGEHVHKAVLAAHEIRSGITIHFVNEHYDSGTIIFQASCPVYSEDTPDTLAARIHPLEHHYLPIIEDLLCSRDYQ